MKIRLASIAAQGMAQRFVARRAFGHRSGSELDRRGGRCPLNDGIARLHADQGPSTGPGRHLAIEFGAGGEVMGEVVGRQPGRPEDHRGCFAGRPDREVEPHGLARLAQG